VVFYPRLDTLALLLDKYEQRQYFSSLNLPVPAYTPLETADLRAWTFPVVVKARRHGYDGQGTFIVGSAAELEAVKRRLGNIPLLLEEFIPYAQELAVMGARNPAGEIVIYPVVTTVQENQVCHRVLIPAQISHTVTREIEAMTRYLLQELDAVGIFGLELFLTAAGDIYINEIAPRTHNSGHYTIDACVTSQFAMQLRAVTGLPLTPPTLTTAGAVMVNLLGYEHAHQDYHPQREKISSLPLTYLHWYGKTEARPGRKLGHVTILTEGSDSQEELLAKAQLIEEIWYNRA
jgi:5-(carboxyamino)imidazole ribonucleotide synthase